MQKNRDTFRSSAKLFFESINIQIFYSKSELKVLKAHFNKLLLPESWFPTAFESLGFASLAPVPRPLSVHLHHPRRVGVFVTVHHGAHLLLVLQVVSDVFDLQKHYLGQASNH